MVLTQKFVRLPTGLPVCFPIGKGSNFHWRRLDSAGDEGIMKQGLAETGGGSLVVLGVGAPDAYEQCMQARLSTIPVG